MNTGSSDSTDRYREVIEGERPLDQGTNRRCKLSGRQELSGSFVAHPGGFRALMEHKDLKREALKAFKRLLTNESALF